MTLSYPYKFWSYSNQSAYLYTRKEEDGHIVFEIELPGIEKDSVSISHSSETNSINIKVNDRDLGDIRVLRLIDADNIDAELNLGILKIRAPIKNSNKAIPIK